DGRGVHRRQRGAARRAHTRRGAGSGTLSAMDEVLTMMREAAGRTADLVESVSGDELSLPTPCSEYDVKGLINHLEWAMTLFEQVGEGGGFPPEKEYTGDFRARAQRMLAVWERPETWEGTCAAMGGLPMATLARMAL